MKPYTDDELTRKLGTLGEPFQPTEKQKRKIHQYVKTYRRTVHFKPVIVNSWEGIIMKQQDSFEVTNYYVFSMQKL